MVGLFEKESQHGTDIRSWQVVIFICTGDNAIGDIAGDGKRLDDVGDGGVYEEYGLDESV